MTAREEEPLANRAAPVQTRAPTPLWLVGLILLGAGAAVWFMVDTGVLHIKYFTQAKRAQVVQLCQARAQAEYGPIDRWTNNGDANRVNRSDFDVDKFYWLDEARKNDGKPDPTRAWISCDVKNGKIIDFRVFEAK
ncbi:hypothetical protein [Deinococcus sp. QL22]|uniref:hypothetical protein n=1 Tax=Deinococcus sp. QL22 TaxID=2939437 RepID=UPI002016CB91|nr:hypothetical protein [Deinococcus sp. QL22]UQN04868.1 hypothetical protein M1R55_08000 [Deinococcus sp. QL22]